MCRDCDNSVNGRIEKIHRLLHKLTTKENKKDMRELTSLIHYFI